MDTTFVNESVKVELVANGKAEEIEFGELTIEQSSKLDRWAENEARKAWTDRVNGFATNMQKEEKIEFLIEAARKMPNLDEEKRAILSSNEGIKKAFNIYGIAEKLYDMWIANKENMANLLKAWFALLGIKQSEDKGELPLEEVANPQA